jgi:glyoxylase-like metal-dependent hydrolase (beta-lactamase superfamily II)
MESGSFAARNRFGRDGRVGRIATPTPLGVGDINSYLLFPPRGSDGVTLIDTGVKTPESFAALQNGLKEFGVGFDEIERILVTHAHMDHFGQAKRIRDLSGAAVFASSGEAELMRFHFSPSGDRRDVVMQYFARWGVPLALISGESRMAEFARQIQDPIEVDGTIEDGDSIAVHDLQLRVVATPGHCDAHIVFHEAGQRWLFSGDHLLTDISPVPLLVFPKEPGAPRPKSLVRFFDSLARVERLDCELVFPSHGDVIRDHRRLIAGYRLHHEKRKLQMLRKLHSGPLSAWQLAAALFPKVYETQVFLVMSEVIGHLDLLLDEGSAVLEERDGVEYARAVA